MALILLKTYKRFQQRWPTIRLKKPLFEWARLVYAGIIHDTLPASAQDYLINQACGAGLMQTIWLYMEGMYLSTAAECTSLVADLAVGYKDPQTCVKYWRERAEKEMTSSELNSPLGLDRKPIGAATISEGHARACEELTRRILLLKTTGKEDYTFDESCQNRLLTRRIRVEIKVKVVAAPSNLCSVSQIVNENPGPKGQYELKQVFWR